MSAVYSNLDGGPTSPAVIDLARQLVKISRSLEDVEREDPQAPSWNQVFFHEPPLSEKNAAHWLTTAMDGAHGGQIVPLSACLIIFAQWMLRLEGDKRSREQLFIEAYYKKTLGYKNKANEPDSMLASRAEVDLASRKRILTIRDISPVVANSCGTMLLSEHAVGVHAGEKMFYEVGGKSRVDVFLKLRFMDPTLRDLPCYSVLQNILNNMVSGEINKFIDENARRVAELNNRITQNKAAANAYIDTLASSLKAVYQQDPLDKFNGLLGKIGNVLWITKVLKAGLEKFSQTNHNKENAEALLEVEKRKIFVLVNSELRKAAEAEVEKLDKEAERVADDIEKKIDRLQTAWNASKLQQRKRVKNIASPFLRLHVKFPILPISSTLGVGGIRTTVANAVTQELKFQFTQDDNMAIMFAKIEGLETPVDNHPKFDKIKELTAPPKLKIAPLNSAHPHITRDINDHEIEFDGKRVIADPNVYDIYKKLEQHNDAKVSELRKEIFKREAAQKEADHDARLENRKKLERKILDNKNAADQKIADTDAREKAFEANQRAHDEKVEGYERDHAAQLERISEQVRDEDARLDALKSGLEEREEELLRLAKAERASIDKVGKTMDIIKKQRDADRDEFRKFVEDNKSNQPTRRMGYVLPNNAGDSAARALSFFP